jgi:hypothetical protein
VAGVGPWTGEVVPLRLIGAVSALVLVFFTANCPRPPSFIPDYPPKHPHATPLCPINGENHPFCRPQAYPPSRLPLWPRLARVIETVCITPFALYYIG